MRGSIADRALVNDLFENWCAPDFCRRTTISWDIGNWLACSQPGDVPMTYADSSVLEADYGSRPTNGIHEGLRAFAKWYKAFY